MAEACFEETHIHCLQLGPVELAVFSVPMLDPLQLPTLTRAERDVLSRLLEGASNAEIAAARGASVRTVANQCASIFRKLGVHSRAELVAKQR